MRCGRRCWAQERAQRIVVRGPESVKKTCYLGDRSLGRCECARTARRSRRPLTGRIFWSVSFPMIRVALAIPCYVDQLRPQAARAALTLLERLGCEVSLDFDAPCCGQPMFNAGVDSAARAAAANWAHCSGKFDAVVMPSGSCTAHVRHHLGTLVAGPAAAHAARATYELCEFIAGPLGMTHLTGSFPHRVAMHLGCHAQRLLRLGGSTELHQPLSGPMHGLLAGLAGLELVPLSRIDECCGFGGSFAVGEPDVSVSMGRDKLADALQHGADVLVSSDPSCLLHLEAVARHGGAQLRTMHVAELLEEATR